MSSGGAREITGESPMTDALYVKAKTCVWWDIENCQVPRSCDPYSIAQNISKSLADLNYKGVVTISAYGDTTKINSSVQQALSSTGIALNHVPAGIKDASDKKILVDMLIWGYDNPPPANHLLISGDRDFANALHQLSMRRYNILLAQPEKVSQALVSAAKSVWLWTSLVEGGRPLEKIPNLHNTFTNSKSNIETESNNMLYSSKPNDFNQKNNNNGNSDNGNKAKQISKTQSQPVFSTSSSNGNEEGNKQSIGSSDSSNPYQNNYLKHPNHMFDLTAPELGSICITSNTNPTPCIPKSQKIADSVKFNAPCGPTSKYTSKSKQKYGNKIPSNTTTSTTDGSGAQESTINDTTKINNNSTLSRPSPLVVPESSEPCLSAGSTSAYIQSCPDMVISNHKNELTQPSHVHEAKGGNINNSSGCFSTKSSSQVLPESNSPDAPKNNTNTTFTNNRSNSKVKIVIKRNRKKNHKQQQNQYSKSYLQSRNLPRSNYNYSSNSSPAPTIRPNNIQSVSSTMPYVSPSTPIPDISTSSSNVNEEGKKQSIESSDSSNPNQKNYSSSSDSSNPIPDNYSSSSSPEPTIRPNNIHSVQSVSSTMPYVSPSTPIPDISTSSSNVNEEGKKQSIESSDSSNPNQKNDLKHPIFVAQPEKLSHALVSAAKTMWQWTSLVVGGGPVEKIPNDDTLTNSNSTKEIQSNSNNGNFDNHNNAKQISKTEHQPIISMSSSNGDEEGSKQSIGSSDSSNPNQKDDSKHPNHTFVSTIPDLGSNCITSNTNPTPCIPKPPQLVDSGKSNAPCGSTVNYTPKTEQNNVKKIPSNTSMSATDGSGAQESTVNDMTKINNSSTFCQPSPLVVPESSKPCPDMASSIELTQPSHVHDAQEGGNISNTSSSFSTKSSSQVLPESNSPNAPKINANSKVKIVWKRNRKKNHKQLQNHYSQSYFQSRNCSGSNYNHSSSSSPAPTIRSNNYQSVPSTMPNISPSTPLPDISKPNGSNHPYPTQSMCGSAISTGNTRSKNRSGGNLRRPASANFLQGQMKFILEALNILKSEKISPTEANISDCISYGNISVLNFNVKMALDYAVEHQVVVMHKLGNCMALYVGTNNTLWNCVNSMDSNANHGPEKFDAVHKFLSSADGRSAILSSQCRYQAALILRQLCLKNLVLGEILQILHTIIQFRWIIPHASGWQPLAVTVLINSNDASTSSSSTTSGWE